MNDLTVLANLSGLVSVDLYNNPVTDVSPLGALTNLGRLDLSWDFYATHFAALSAATKLTNLYVRGISFRNIAFVQVFKKLSVLNLDDTSISDVSPLSGLTDRKSVV